MPSFPHPDEEQLALKLYAREIEENNLYSAVAEEVLRDWKEFQGQNQDYKIILI